MGFTATWLRIDLPRRWRQLVLLTVLVAISAGTVLTAVAGARRGNSAMDRLLEDTRPATFSVRANSETDTAPGWSQIRAMPGVEAVTTFSEYTGFGIDEAPADPVQQFIPLDDSAMRDIERPVVLSGRLANPGDLHEAVVTANFARTWHRNVGDQVTVRLFSVQQIDTGQSAVSNLPRPRPAGPTIPVRIVGVIRSPYFGDAAGDPGRLFPSLGVYAAYPNNVLGAVPCCVQSGLIRVRNIDADLTALQDQIRRIPRWGAADVVPRSPAISHTRDVARFEAACLLAFAAVALLVAMVIVGLLISRITGVTSDDLTLMRAVGMTRTQSLSAAAAGPIIAGAVGAPIGALLALPASRWMPFGTAATVERSPGIDADLLVLPLGMVVAIALVAALALASAALRARTNSQGRQGLPDRPIRPSSVLVAGRGLPVPVVLGTRLALDPDLGAGRSPVTRALPVRVALLAAVIGVIGVTAAGTFRVAVRDAAEHPARFGQYDQLSVGVTYLNNPGPDPAALVDVLRRDPDVTAVLDGPFSIAASSAGTVTTFSSDPRAAMQPAMISGRPPVLPGEVALAPGTASKLGATIGSPVTLIGDRAPQPLMVTGIGLVPQTQYSEYDSGAWVSTLDYQDLFDVDLIHFLRVSLRPGADPNAVAGRYRAASRQIPLASQAFVAESRRPARMAELRDLEPIPLALAVFLAVLAIGTTGSSLATSTRRHRRDIAVLRALGMTPRQSRAVSSVQAAAVAVLAVAIGLPLGLALGRVLWRFVARSTPVLDQPPQAVLFLIALLPVTLLITQLLAWPSGRRSARLRMADVLRAE